MKLKVIDAEKTGILITHLFKDNGVSVRQVKEALNLEYTRAIYYWINASGKGKPKNIPSTDNLVLLAQLFDVRIDDLLVLRETEIELVPLARKDIG